MKNKKYSKEKIDMLIYTKNRCFGMANNKKSYKKGFPRAVYLEDEEYRCYQIEVSEGKKLRYFCYDSSTRGQYIFVYKKLGFIEKLKRITFESKCKKVEANLNHLLLVMKNLERARDILEEQGITKYNKVVA